MNNVSVNLLSQTYKFTQLYIDKYGTFLGKIM